jgi:pimeloyl-ACP methyl ester carboxylesterase
MKWMAVVLSLTVMVGSASAQKRGDRKEIPEPEAVNLTTSDGLALKATFYPGTRGIDTVPIVILHDFKGNRNEYDALALTLQSLGHAVLVPDLRGHGESTKLQAGPREQAIEAAKMTRPDFEKIIRFDRAAVRDFLVNRNNKEEFNLNRLGIIGVGMGSVMAVHWADQDYREAVLTGGRGLGRNVKGVVLISPERNFKGVPIHTALQNPFVRATISVYILVGAQDAKARGDAENIYSLFERYHPKPEPDQAAEKQDLFIGKLETSLQGLKLLEARELKLDAAIAQFIDLRLVKPDFPWTERWNP